LPYASGIYELIYGKVGFLEGVSMIMENRKHHEFEYILDNAERAFPIPSPESNEQPADKS